MTHWTQELVEAEISYRNELRKIREAQGMFGRPVPMMPSLFAHWRKHERRHTNSSGK